MDVSSHNSQSFPRSRTKRLWIGLAGIVIVCLFLCLFLLISILIAVRLVNNRQVHSPSFPITPTMIIATPDFTPTSILVIPTTKPTITPTPSATSTVNSPNDEHHYRDNFTNPASGWSVVSEADYSMGYGQPSHYEIKVKKPNWMYYAIPPYAGLFRPHNDVIVSVQARGGVQEGSYFGVICRLKDDQNFYMAAIGGGIYNISKKIDGQWTNLTLSSPELPGITPTPQDSLAITLNCIDDRIALTVNGHTLPLVNDSDLSTGDVALLAGSGKQATVDGIYAEAYFADFSITLP